MLKARRVFSSKKCFNAWLKKNFSCTLSWAFCFTGTTSVCVVDSFCWASASTRTRDSKREEGEKDNSGLNHKKTTSDNSQIFACDLYNIEGTYRYGTLQLTRGHNSNSWWSRWIKCIVNWLKTTSRGANLTKNRRNRRIFLKSNMADSSLLQLVLRKSRTCAGRDIVPLKLINCNLFSCGECLLAFLQGIPLLFVYVFWDIFITLKMTEFL